MKKGWIFVLDDVFERVVCLLIRGGVVNRQPSIFNHIKRKKTIIIDRLRSSSKVSNGEGCRSLHINDERQKHN